MSPPAGCAKEDQVYDPNDHSCENCSDICGDAIQHDDTFKKLHCLNKQCREYVMREFLVIKESVCEAEHHKTVALAIVFCFITALLVGIIAFIMWRKNSKCKETQANRRDERDALVTSTEDPLSMEQGDAPVSVHPESTNDSGASSMASGSAVDIEASSLESVVVDAVKDVVTRMAAETLGVDVRT